MEYSNSKFSDSALHRLFSLGFRLIKDKVFFLNNSYYDLSAADLSKLPYTVSSFEIKDTALFMECLNKELGLC